VARRIFPTLLALVTALAALAAIPASSSASASTHTTNPIVRENRHKGTDRWDIPWRGYKITDDRKMNIKGYATATSVHTGNDIGLRISTKRREPYSIDIYRLGYYQGHDGRHIERLGPFNGRPQPKCITVKATHMITCPWHTSVRLHVPRTWTSGVYFAVLTTSRSHYQSEITFTVRDSRPADIVYVSPVNTYQAYNNFPYDPPAKDNWNSDAHPRTGTSLYDYNSPKTAKFHDGRPAVKVSFNRPYCSQYGNPGNGGLTDFEPFTIAFLEQHGYDVTYTTDVDVDERPNSLLDHKIVLISGHSEYWSARAYDAAYAARDAGVNLFFLASNEIYWHVRYQNDAPGHTHRIVIGYKDFKRDPIADPAKRTIQWRQQGRPEQELSGVQFPSPDGYMDWGGQPLVPINTDRWPFAGTGLKDGVPVKGELAGYEIDAYDPHYPAPAATWRRLLTSSPFTNYNGDPYTQNSSVYRAHSGALVFATGSMDWAWALSPGGSSDGTKNNVRHSLQRLTQNVLHRMLR
jgi:N,N-dimethylformamidase beta subunit-like, C-terminal